MAGGAKVAAAGEVAADAGTIPAAALAAVDEAIKPYKIHIPNKYLDQVRRKLELTRLPHEGSEPKSEDWWEPKPLVEPLIDYWLDKYNWRDHESALNSNLPQFRTAIPVSSLESPIRLHFIHVRSPHEHAVPLLLIPAFPFTNLSFGHLVKPLTDPEDATSGSSPPFHLVIPSLPGLGFSDPLPNNLAPVPATAEVLNSLMARLSYPQYLASGAAPGHSSPAEIDWRLINRLATQYPSSCVGAHFISPPLKAPKLEEAPWEWVKWSVANFFHTEMLGYSMSDFAALDRIHRRPGPSAASPPAKHTAGSSPAKALDLYEPNTLAYALCDSPGGMLAFILKGLRSRQPTGNGSFSQAQLITLTNLAWLPGPEYAMRFWAHCAAHDQDPVRGTKDKTTRASTTRPTIAITVFVGENRRAVVKTTTSPVEDIDIEATAGESTTTAVDSILLTSIVKQPHGIRLTGPDSVVGAAGGAGKQTTERYICPAWANGRYRVVHTQRATGSGGGLLAFERPSVVVDGIRGLAKGVLAMADSPFNTRDKKKDDEEKEKETGAGAGEGGGKDDEGKRTAPAPLEAVVVVPSGAPLPTVMETASPTATTTTRPKAETPAPTPAADKGKGKELLSSELLSPPPQLPRDHSFGDGESPDTLVEKTNSPSPLLGDHATVVSSSNEPSPSRSPLGIADGEAAGKSA